MALILPNLPVVANNPSFCHCMPCSHILILRYSCYFAALSQGSTYPYAKRPSAGAFEPHRHAYLFREITQPHLCERGFMNTATADSNMAAVISRQVAIDDKRLGRQVLLHGCNFSAHCECTRKDSDTPTGDDNPRGSRGPM